MDRGFYPSMLSHCLYVNPAKPAFVASSDLDISSNNENPHCLNIFASRSAVHSQAQAQMQHNPQILNQPPSASICRNQAFISHHNAVTPASMQKRSIDDICQENNLSAPLPDNHQPHQKRIKGHY